MQTGCITHFFESMLIQEEELRYLPAFDIKKTESVVVPYLWQHCLGPTALSDFAHIYFPLLHFEDFDNLSNKRLIERLSVSMLAAQVVDSRTRILHADTGAPYLAEGGLHISVSHSNHIYALSLSAAKHGIDVEQWGSKAYKVRKHFLQPDEEMLMTELTSKLGGMDRAATLLWSAKESAYKFLNDKQAFLLSDIHLYAADERLLMVDFPNHNMQASIEYVCYPHCIQTCCR